MKTNKPHSTLPGKLRHVVCTCTHLYEAAGDGLEDEVVARRWHVLQGPLHHMVTVGVEGELHHAGAQGARDHRRLGVRAAELQRTQEQSI